MNAKRDECQETPQSGLHHVEDHVDAQMSAGLYAIGRADQNKPGEQEDGRFQCPENVVVEDVARNDVGEGDHRHKAENDRDQRLLDLVDHAPERRFRLEVHGPPPARYSPYGTARPG
jgi:hypothetical protein